MTTIIHLTRGYEAIVDDIDSDLAAFKWQAVGKAGKVYAGRNIQRHHVTTHLNLHRVIYERVIGRELLKTEFIDHIDLDRMNCQRNNLRIATNGQNRANTGLQKNNSSGYKGVYWNAQTGKWVAQIRMDGKSVSLGYYSDPKEASEAFKKASVARHGEFARFE